MSVNQCITAFANKMFQVPDAWHISLHVLQAGSAVSTAHTMSQLHHFFAPAELPPRELRPPSPPRDPRPPPRPPRLLCSNEHPILDASLV